MTIFFECFIIFLNLQYNVHWLILQADILQCAHACDVVILMHHKHGLREMVTCYGTEGAGVSFIGNKMDVKRSQGGEMALMLFQKFMQGKFFSVTLVAAMSKNWRS